MNIGAILSDYDGTLCPTAFIGSRIEDRIPLRLEQVLWKISDKIPICIVTSKDFAFIHCKTIFANAASCILGLETLVLDHSNLTWKKHDDDCVTSSSLSVNLEILQRNAQFLSLLANHISDKFKDLKIEQKFTLYGSLLAGVTADWRHLENWDLYRENVKASILNFVSDYDNEDYYSPYLLEYTTHPFVDIYSTECSKSTAFDTIVKKLDINKKIMYLGDSENDNPAFHKADLSVGVISDWRLKPNLDCDYLIDFGELSELLLNLQSNDFVFTEEIIP